MNIPYSNLKRVVIIGAGFGGLKIAKLLNRQKFQVILIDKNNYHTFQPLLYQVATAGLEPDSIVNSIRNIIKNNKNFFFRLTKVRFIDTKLKKVFSNIGEIEYDYLIIATGSQTNYFGNQNIETFALPMKSIIEALTLRSCILQNFETALFTTDIKERERLMTFVIIGGGPTGVELAGALAELKNHILPKDYPELDIKKMTIHLIQATSRLLDGMSNKLSKITYKYLQNMGVNIWLNTPVYNYDGTIVYMKNHKLESLNVIWAAGVKGCIIDGFQKNDLEKGRLLVNNYNQLIHYNNIFAIGDVALMKTPNYPYGHPMTAQPAVQQGICLANNLNRIIHGKSMLMFNYKNLGSMATIGRNKAVCDLPWIKISGFLAWLMWMFVHLINLIGFRNRMIALVNWIIQYYQYNKSVRVILRPYYRIKKDN